MLIHLPMNEANNEKIAIDNLIYLDIRNNAAAIK